MTSKSKVIRRVELIDQLSTILKDLRRSEMEELERMEAEEGA
jgi:flagellar motor component MotA